MSLSIIIPHFNGSDLLETLLASIPQDKKIQTIVVDDKSDLLNLNRIKKLQNMYNFEFYQNERNKSAGTCRNIGIEKAKGKWIMFADSDDYFVDGFYEKVSKYFDSDKDIVFFSPTSQYIDTGEVADRHLSFKKIIEDYLKDKNKKNEFFLRYNFVSPWSKLIKKEFLDNYKIRFDEGPIGAEDVMLSTKIGYFMKNFGVDTDVIYCRIVRYGSITRVFNEYQFDIRLKARISRINFLKTNLSQKEFGKIMIPFIRNKAAEFLLLSFRRFGYKKFFQVYNLYRRENIKWFRLVYLNPIKVLIYIFAVFIKYLKHNKYNIKFNRVNKTNNQIYQTNQNFDSNVFNLSIIIPHFNGSGLLETLLASIPQDKKIQTIVVDDKSDLLNLNRIKKLQNMYNFEFYQNERNKSAGTCRNIGIEKAKGKWIMFADSDDYFVDGFYEKVSKYFDSDKDIVFFSPTSQYIDTGEVADRHLSFKKIIEDYLKDKNKKNEFFLRYNFVSPWSKLIKKEFLDNYKIRFDEGPIGAEDVMLSTKIGYFMKNFGVDTDVIYCRIVRYGSITRVFNEYQFDIRLKARISRINFLKTNLSQKEFGKIMIPFIRNKAAEFLLLSFRRFGYKKFFQVYNLYRRENIKWFRLVYLNPLKVLKFIYIETIKYSKNKRYNKAQSL